MKTILISIVFSFIGIFTLAQQVPQTVKTEFSEESLKQTVSDLNNKKITIQSVFAKHKGKIIVVEFWAGWCKDCIIGMPASHKLKEKNSEVDFIYLSLDRSFDSWKKGIENFQLETGDNYWFSSGWKNPFNEYIDLNWIPRYMIIDQEGKIAKYYAINADDPELQSTIDKLLLK